MVCMTDFTLDNFGDIINALHVAVYVHKQHGNFEKILKKEPYFHMGATIIDAILQAGMNYKNVVYPRVLNLLKSYPEYKTTCDFLILMQTIPIARLISWKNEDKLSRINELAWFLHNQKIETEQELACWLDEENNIKKLFSIRGIGPKTVDYLKILSGCPAIAIDRHLFKFLEIMGIQTKSYDYASSIFISTAAYLDISMYELDRKIWLYMSKKSYL